MLGADLLYHFLNVVVLTAVVAAFVLWQYRRAVLRGMQHADGVTLNIPALPVQGAAAATLRPLTPSQPMHTSLPQGGASLERGAALATEASRADAPGDAATWERRFDRRLAIAYLLSVAVPALMLALYYLYRSGIEPGPSQIAAMTWIALSAAVPMIAVSLGMSFLRAVLWWVGLILTGAVLTVALAFVDRVLLVGKPPTLAQFKVAIAYFSLVATHLWAPFALLLFTGARTLRGIVPIAFAGLLVFGLAPLAGSRVSQLLAQSEGGSDLLLRLGFNGMFLLLAIPVGLVAWWCLRRIARSYDAKRFSDAQLLAASWWLMFTFLIAVELASARPAPLLSVAACMACALVFPPLNRFFLHLARFAPGRPPTRTLLLLRMFGYTARTERLFDRIGPRWRKFGPVIMIAGPDVVARTVDPGDFLRFVSGRVGEGFVRSQADLEQRLAILDLVPDPDGRYRVNELWCRENTWQATASALIARADAVLMDLRGLAAMRHGVDFELRQLAARIPLERVVLAVDSSTDRALIDAALAGGVGSPRWVTIEKDRRSASVGVFNALMSA